MKARPKARVVRGDRASPNAAAEALQGKLASQFSEKKLMHLVLDNDSQAIKDGKLLKEAFNQGLSALTPDLVYEQLVEDYRLAERLYGKTIIRLITGYSNEYLKQNLRIPEFKLKLKGEIEAHHKRLVKEGYLDKEGGISSQGEELASIALYIEELERFSKKGPLSGMLQKLKHVVGEPEGTQPYRKGLAYKHIDLRKTLKLAMRRGHAELLKEDFVAKQRSKRAQKIIVFALDISSSMRGEKLDYAKKAGIALAFKAAEEGNKVGLVAFSTEVLLKKPPTSSFQEFLGLITPLSPKKETNIAEAIKQASELFPKRGHTKHIILLTDAMPTYGKAPERAALAEVSKANAQGITLSLVGIKLDKHGESHAEQLVELGRGRLYIVEQISGLDKLVLMDYYSLK
jgi:Mg-chelatase subunit ChlD